MVNLNLYYIQLKPALEGSEVMNIMKEGAGQELAGVDAQRQATFVAALFQIAA